MGLINLVYDYCQEEYGVDMREEAQKMKENTDYEPHRIAENIRLFNILSRRARGFRKFYVEYTNKQLGESPTVAAWIRSFVMKHPKYGKDSIITPVRKFFYWEKLKISKGNSNRFNKCNECYIRL